MKFATKPIRHYPPHLRHVATLPWKIQSFCSSADMEENTSKLHLRTDFNSCTRVTVYAECICVLTEQNRGRNPLRNFFSAHVYCGQMAGWIKMVLGMAVGLSPGDFVLDGDPAPLNFWSTFIIVIVISLEHCTSVRRHWIVQV